MSIYINIRYIGKNGSAKKFAEEMEKSGIAKRIREEEGNIRYEYFEPLVFDESILLIDEWKDQKSLDIHHASTMMQEISRLREKYDLHMTVERFERKENNLSDDSFIRK